MLLLQERYVSVAFMETSLLIERYKGIYHATELGEVQGKLVTTYCPRNVDDVNGVSETIDNHGKRIKDCLYRSLYIQQMYCVILHQFVQINVGICTKTVQRYVHTRQSPLIQQMLYRPIGAALLISAEESRAGILFQQKRYDDHYVLEHGGLVETVRTDDQV